MVTKDEKTEKEDEEPQNEVGLEAGGTNTAEQDQSEEGEGEDEEEEEESNHGRASKIPRLTGTQPKALVAKKLVPKRPTRKATRQYLYYDMFSYECVCVLRCIVVLCCVVLCCVVLCCVVLRCVALRCVALRCL